MIRSMVMNQNPGSAVLQLCDSWSNCLAFLYLYFLVCQVKIILGCIKIKKLIFFKELRILPSNSKHYKV